MQTFPVYEIVRAVERDLDRQHAELERRRAAQGSQPRARRIPRNPITAVSAAIEWWFRPGEIPQA